MVVWVRFIPTLVGNTSVVSFGAGKAAVHPHACGEHAMDAVHEYHSARFIPTLVGNT